MLLEKCLVRLKPAGQRCVQQGCQAVHTGLLALYERGLTADVGTIQGLSRIVGDIRPSNTMILKIILHDKSLG